MGLDHRTKIRRAAARKQGRVLRARGLGRRGTRRLFHALKTGLVEVFSRPIFPVNFGAFKKEME